MSTSYSNMSSLHGKPSLNFQKYHILLPIFISKRHKTQISYSALRRGSRCPVLVFSSFLFGNISSLSAESNSYNPILIYCSMSPMPSQVPRLLVKLESQVGWGIWLFSASSSYSPLLETPWHAIYDRVISSPRECFCKTNHISTSIFTSKYHIQHFT